MFKIRFLSIILALLLFSQCKLFRKIVREEEKVHLIPLDELLRKADSAAFHYTLFSFKAKMNVKSAEQSIGFKGNFRLKKDSCVWSSFTAVLGLEAARVLLTYDSLKVLDRIHSECHFKPYRYLKDEYHVPVDFPVLEEVLSGNIFVLPGARLSYFLDTAGYHISYDTAGIAYRFLIDPVRFKVTALSVTDQNNNRALHVSYLNFWPVENQLLSIRRVINFTGETNYQVQMDLTGMIMEDRLSFYFGRGESCK